MGQQIGCLIAQNGDECESKQTCESLISPSSEPSNPATEVPTSAPTNPPSHSSLSSTTKQTETLTDAQNITLLLPQNEPNQSSTLSPGSSGSDGTDSARVQITRWMYIAGGFAGISCCLIGYVCTSTSLINSFLIHRYQLYL